MRADNRGEGGILALMALVAQRQRRRSAARAAMLIVLGLFGAALLYGDGMITPAISVLSAVEGLEVATPLFKPYVVPITSSILIVLFSVQRRGTARIGAVFGPVMLVWFAVIARARHPLDRPAAAGARRHQSRCTPSASSSTTACTASSSSARSFSPSPAAKRSTPTWGTSARSRSSSPGSASSARAAAQLLRPGRAAAPQPERGATIRSIALAPTWALLPAGGAGDGGDGHRVAGGHLRRLLADASGGPARLPAARWRSCTPRKREIGQIYIPR